MFTANLPCNQGVHQEQNCYMQVGNIGRAESFATREADTFGYIWPTSDEVDGFKWNKLIGV